VMIACARSRSAGWRIPVDVALVSSILLQTPPGSVPGVSDTVAITIGTLLTLMVIYAIVAAHRRRRNDRRERAPR